MVVNIKTSPLRPLPMRITPRQFERLQHLRAVDAIAIQEHVRRALDLYLDQAERKNAQANDRLNKASTPAEPLPDDHLSPANSQQDEVDAHIDERTAGDDLAPPEHRTPSNQRPPAPKLRAR